jgi:hypothetical protein
MKRLFFILILPVLLLFSCNKEEININPDNLLLGVWSYSNYQSDAAVFARSTKFTDNHCYMFNADGSLTERKNSGWCGTPPVTYADYDGTWRIINDTLIHIRVGYWGGSMTYGLDIERIDSDSLKIVTIPIKE